MPRRPRFAPTECAHHVINRGNDRRCIFREAADFERFLRLLARAKARYPVKVYALCLMPNHFHAVMQPVCEGALSAYLQWVLGRYACDLRSRTQTVGQGHIFQRRFWSDPIQDERHFLSVLRYIEANPVRAGLVDRAESWPWGSIAVRARTRQPVLDQLPMPLPPDWISIVNQRQSPSELDALHNPETRGRPVEATRPSHPEPE
jgi:putative transposase